jgi:hypothetical protein
VCDLPGGIGEDQRDVLDAYASLIPLNPTIQLHQPHTQNTTCSTVQLRAPLPRGSSQNVPRLEPPGGAWCAEEEGSCRNKNTGAGQGAAVGAPVWGSALVGHRHPDQLHEMPGQTKWSQSGRQGAVSRARVRGVLRVQTAAPGQRSYPSAGSSSLHMQRH